MNKWISFILIFILVGLVSCERSNHQHHADHELLEESLIFPKGSKIENEHFHGTAWLQSLVVSDSTNHIALGSVTFEPGARTNWHIHPDGQIVVALSGVGYYQEEGSDKIIMRKGDVVTCPHDTPHWHGASADQEFVQMAVTSRLKGPTEWLQAVTDEEYHAGGK